MGWKELLASVIGTLAWPLTALAMFLMIRGRLVQLIEKIGTLRYKDLELDFSKLKQANSAITSNDSISEEGKSVVIKNAEAEKVHDSLEEQIFEAVESNPVVAILLSWSYVETSLSSANSRLMPEAEAESFSSLKNIQFLERAGQLSPKQLQLLHEMRNLRNKLVHRGARTLDVSSEQALDYATTAIEFARFLDRLNRNRKLFILPKGQWIALPDGFAEVKDLSANVWMYSDFPIPGTDLTAGVGRWTKDKETVCFGIDIEQPRKDGCTTIAELRIDLRYISKEKINATARSIVSFNEESRIVSFDLGNSVFKFQLS